MLFIWPLTILLLSQKINRGKCTDLQKERSVAGPDDNPKRDFDKLDLDSGTADDAFYEEWDDVMRNFHPKAYLSVVVSGRNIETFYELVEKPMTLIRGIFYTLEEEGNEFEIGLIIKSPKGDILYNKMASEGIFSITATIPGEYVFELSNLNWMTEVPATFIIGTDDHGLLLSEHIENTSNNLSRLKSSIDGIYSQYHYLWYRGQKQVAAAIAEQKKLMIYAIVQLILIFTCSFIGIWNIKKMVSSTRTL